MSDIQGMADLKARLKAIRTKVASPAAKAWQADAVTIGRDRIGSMRMPYSKGNLLSSIDAKRTGTGKISSTNTKAVVVGSYHGYFVDAGPKPHTIFAKATRKHPGYKARPFRIVTAAEAYRRNPVRDFIIKAWNGAA